MKMYKCYEVNDVTLVGEILSLYTSCLITTNAMCS